MQLFGVKTDLSHFAILEGVKYIERLVSKGRKCKKLHEMIIKLRKRAESGLLQGKWNLIIITGTQETSLIGKQFDAQELTNRILC